VKAAGVQGTLRLVVFLVVWAIASPVTAESESATATAESESATWSIVRQVVFDPTTYAPAITSFAAERVDWKSSQVFFQHGYLEQNPQFTVSGLPNDAPLDYDAGKRQINGNALRDLGVSAINNTAARIVERMLMEHYPGRRKLIRTIGWIERISFAVTFATIQSSNHFRQWRENERLARESGYK
jgi:hypothetical protein